MNNISEEGFNVSSSNSEIIKNINICDFSISESILNDVWNTIDKKSSPSRKVGDIFWSQLDWDSYKDIKILDIGCGKGGDLLKFYHARVGDYVGIDPDYHGIYSSVDGALSRYNEMKKILILGLLFMVFILLKVLSAIYFILELLLINQEFRKH